jgi:putative ABC transport system permease protein
MRGWRTALRVAWREAKRAKGRSALVIAMITLPVMALVFVVVNFDTFELSADEQANRLMGTAQAAVSWPVDGPVRQEPEYLTGYPVDEAPAGATAPTDQRLLAQLPAGTEAIRDLKGSLTVHTADGVGTVGARLLDYTNPLAQGILRPLSGRAPSAADEVALTPAASTRLGSGVDGTVRLADSSGTFRVTAIVEDPTDLDATTVVLRSGPLRVDRQDMKWLVRTPNPLTWTDVKQLNTHGLTLVSRQVLADPPAAADRYQIGIGRGGSKSDALVLVGGLAALEVVLLAGAAFAVGARRRQRDLALVAASGGTPGHVRKIVLADGVVHGVAAAVVGVVLGLAAAAVTVPLVEGIFRTRAGDLRISVPALVILAGMAVVTGVLAALVPAWISSRQNVVTALAGRRGITRSRRRWIVVGLVLAAVGVGLSTWGALQVDFPTVVIGLVVAEFALVLCTPALVGLVARLGRWLPLPARIALRDASRNRTAAAPAISAVMAAVIGSLLAAVVLGAGQEHDQLTTSMGVGDVFVYSPDEARPPSFQQAESALRGSIPVDQMYEIKGVTCGGQACSPYPRVPGDRACPYIGYVLGHRATADEQHAAVQDPRCTTVKAESLYFGVWSVGGPGMGLTAVIDPAAAGAVSGIPAADVEQVAAALRAGKVVVDDPNTVDNGNVTMSLEKFGPQTTSPRMVTTPGFALPHRPQAGITMLTEATARSLGLDTTPTGVLATTTRMPTVAESDRLQAVLGTEFGISVERGPNSDNQTLIVLAIVAGVITLGAAALATGLAAADGRADLSTLAAVGASPRLRRTLSLSQSGVIAGLGSLLGAIAGVGAAAAVLTALNQGYANQWPTPAPYPITVPWLNLAITVVVVPLVAMLGAGLLTRSRLPIEHRL